MMVSIDVPQHILQSRMQSTEQELPVESAPTLEAGQPTIYANGFICGHTYTDAFIICQTNNSPVGAIHFSFESLKSLSEALASIVTRIETVTGKRLLTSRELQELFSNNNILE